MDMALAGVDGRGQLDERKACMLGMGVRGRSKFFISPCMATFAQVSPASSSNMLKPKVLTDPVEWFCNIWTLCEAVRLDWEVSVGSSRRRGLPHWGVSGWCPRGRGRLVCTVFHGVWFYTGSWSPGLPRRFAPGMPVSFNSRFGSVQWLSLWPRRPHR